MPRDAVSDRYISADYLDQNPTWDLEDSPWKAKFVTQLLTPYQPRHICEIGCGAGGVLAGLRSRFPQSELYGYDIAPDATQFWKKYQDKNIHFTVGDFFADSNKHYDAILLLDVIEHLKNPFEFLQKVKSHADYIVFHIPLDLSALSVLRERPLINARKKVGHIHSFTKQLALSLLQESGFDIIKYFYSGAAFNAPQRNFKTKVASIPRRVLRMINTDFSVRLMGGETLWVLVKSHVD